MPEQLPPVRPWYTSWRVRWRRAGWAEPKYSVSFGTYDDAVREAHRCAMHQPSKADGEVVEVVIESRVVSAWHIEQVLAMMEAEQQEDR